MALKIKEHRNEGPHPDPYKKCSFNYQWVRNKRNNSDSKMKHGVLSVLVTGACKFWIFFLSVLKLQLQWSSYY